MKVSGGVKMERLAKLLYLGIILAIGYFLFPIFTPFLVALVVAIVFDPLIIDLQRRIKVKRHTSAIIVLTIFFIGVFFILYISISSLVKETIEFVKAVPSSVETFIHENDKVTNMYNNLSDETKQYIMDSSNTLAAKGTEIGSKFAGSLFGFVKNFPTYFIIFIVFMVAVYIIAIELPKLKPRFLSLFDRTSSRGKVELALDKLKTSIVGFLKSQIILSILTFIVTLIGLMIIGTDYAIVMSLVVVVVDLLPVLGTGSVLVPWAIYSFAVGNVGQGIGLIVLFVFITAFRRVVEPKLIGASIGLGALSTLISLYVGFELMGVIGMILGPILAIVVVTLKEAGMLSFKIKI
ncbi:sporulation integral membrane protein YtvI [Priestia megaterium]|nr:sporulation integral membrane protein YtvI [Priestia megaterium]